MESPPSISAQPTGTTRFAVLLFTDIVGSTELKTRHGVPAYSEALRIHNGHFERLAHECLNPRTLQSRGDGYFAEAGSVAEAIRFALLFEEAMREGPWGEVRLTARVGIHTGEVGALNAEDGTWIVGPAADLASRVSDLALGGQILLTRFPFDEARHFIREHPPVAGKTMPPLRWLAHGPYRMKGREEPMEIFEVGAEGLAPLAAPPDSEKAKRAIRPGEEETLGWRPAVGLEIPGRTGWHLTERLGAGGFGEVWVGEQAKLHQRRAFKFCFDDERLRALKREVTLVRLLRSALGERDDIVHIHELKLDAPPFYLESDLAPHGNLLQWAERQGGLGNVPLAQRIALVAHTATALAAAHSIGVLHKDIKPTNILIFDGPNGEPRPRLVDFGIGALADPAILAQLGVTGAGFTRTNVLHSTGTPTYCPPEYLAGKPYTIQGDVYGLGVLLYQLVTGRALEPLASGWERDIADPLLREDIATCVDGDPARRFPSAADLAEHLHSLDRRRAEIEENERLARENVERAQAEANANAARSSAARLRRLTTAFGALTLIAAAGGLVAWNRDSQNRALLMDAARYERLFASELSRVEQEQLELARLANTNISAHSSDLLQPMNVVAKRKVDEAMRRANGAISLLDRWQHLLPAAILRGHLGTVVGAQFSPDGQRILTASEDGTARVWEVSTGKELMTLSGHKGPVASAQFSPDGQRILTASEDGTARVWEVSTGKELATLQGHGKSVGSAQFSPDGKRIVTTSPDSVGIWDTSTEKSLVTYAPRQKLKNAQFSPDGRQVIVRIDDTEPNSAREAVALVWSDSSGKEHEILGHLRRINNAEFSPDTKHIVTASADKTARVYGNIRWGEIRETCTLTHGKEIFIARFSPDGSSIVTASADGTAKVWKGMQFGKPSSGDTFWDRGFQSVTLLSGHQDKVYDAQFSPDGSRIVTASADKTARLWDGTSGKLIAILGGHQGKVSSARFSPDGLSVVTSSDERTARVWAILPPTAAPPPEWFSDLLVYIAQMRTNSSGNLEALNPDDWLALRERMREVRRASAGQDTPYLRILRRFVPE